MKKPKKIWLIVGGTWLLVAVVIILFALFHTHLGYDFASLFNPAGDTSENLTEEEIQWLLDGVKEGRKW